MHFVLAIYNSKQGERRFAHGSLHRPHLPWQTEGIPTLAETVTDITQYALDLAHDVAEKYKAEIVSISPPGLTWEVIVVLKEKP